MTTANYNAGLDTSNIVVSYAIETTWATIPSVVFQQIRVTAEDFTSEKTRIRPLEINPYGYAQHAITTQSIGKGSINFGLSFQTFDDFLIGALNSPGWSQFTLITGTAGSTSAVAASHELTSTISSEWAGITVGCEVIVSGFSNAANNGRFTVNSFTTGATPVLVLYTVGTTTPAPLVNETPAGIVTVQVVSIRSTGGDITLTSGTGILSSTTSGKFTGIVAGQWLMLSGFTNAANNGAALVTAVTSGTSITLNNSTNTQAYVTETPTGAAVTLAGQYIQNSNVVTTYSFEKQFASALFFQYLGSYVSSLQLTFAVGKYCEGVINFLVKGQTASTTEAGTATPTIAPGGRIIDNISGFSAFAVNNAAPTSILQSAELTVSKQRSAAQYGIGSATAAGIRRGTLQVDGKLSLFFKDLVYYNDFVNEPDLGISFQLTDNVGNAYVITMPAITIMNPSIVAKGADQDIVADFTLEGNPAPSSNALYPLITIQIDRLPYNLTTP